MHLLLVKFCAPNKDPFLAWLLLYYIVNILSVVQLCTVKLEQRLGHESNFYPIYLDKNLRLSTIWIWQINYVDYMQNSHPNSIIERQGDWLL